jgi:hypothetical protein
MVSAASSKAKARIIYFFLTKKSRYEWTQAIIATVMQATSL